MDRHQAHGVQPLGLERRLALAGLGEVALGRVGQERAQVAPLGALELAGQAHQLAQVGEPPVAAGPGEHGEVVAGGHDRLLEQGLHGRPLGPLALGGEKARDGGDPLAGGQSRARSPWTAPHRPPLLRPAPASSDQVVRGRAAERRGEHREQRGLVVRVGQHAQPGEPVADLLLRPVAAPADDVGGQALLLQRLLEQPQRRGRAHEHHDLAGAPARVDLRPQPVGDAAGLRAPPRLVAAAREAEPGTQVVPALRGGDQQLDRRRAGGGARSNSRSAPSESSCGRPARSGVNRSPSTGANVALSTSSSSSRERKLTASPRTLAGSSAAARARKMATSAWRKR